MTPSSSLCSDNVYLLWQKHLIWNTSLCLHNCISHPTLLHQSSYPFLFLPFENLFTQHKTVVCTHKVRATDSNKNGICKQGCFFVWTELLSVHKWVQLNWLSIAHQRKQLPYLFYNVGSHTGILRVAFKCAESKAANNTCSIHTHTQQKPQIP